ncbi:NADH-quinone oxidoreductase subunit NuoN [Thiohalomonas denitrificans]|uniref:NADH-quinone oxidoreductase subunit N n=1 Tax=Thiohalomonas denitrificans TaxID=415747 RepID=A0A1G5PIT5_9GAMM|nr:NADH-quinone oxidoreductase subunit NuoN [Thiohalomonas denitrificans]SCZ49425.1 NADH-quinone oxidoreductase subunit N [Thiohalomonas denitrificans]
MNFETPDFLPVVPELFVLGMACLILVVDLFLSDRSRVVTYLMSQATLAGALVLTLGLSSPIAQVTMNGTFVLDPMATLLKSMVYIASFVVFLYAKDYLRVRGLFKGEFFLLGLFAVLGMMVLISAHSLLTVYLGLELMSLSLYAMVALHRNSVTASEAAMKYFILGAMASAMLLYGMSMLYGATGTLDLGELGARVQGAGPSSLVLVFGLVFLIVGIAFKLGAVPFHMWVPDVYHGAPTAVTLFVSSAPKLAAFAMLMRLLVDGLPGLQTQWQDMLILLAVLSVALGNVLAIAQGNIKRLLAYSGISHIGFLLMGVLAGTPGGYAAGMYYAIAYVIMTLGGFGMVVLMSRAGFEADRLEDYKGLNERSPWFALMMLILMFSMAGVPPFLGFWAKLAVLEALVSIDLIWVAVVAVVFSVVGAFYYLRVVKYMYFDKAEDEHPLEAGSDLRLLLSANGLAVLGLGIFPGSLLALCVSAIG